MTPDDEQAAAITDAAVLDARTRALAKSAAAPAAVQELEVIDVRVSGELLALPAAELVAVADMERVAPLPHAPPHVAGLIWRADRVLPVFYSHAVMSLPLTVLPEHARIVLLGHQRAELGLVVDSVETARSIDPSSLSEVASSLGPLARAIIRGVDDRGAALIDVPALLSLPSLVIDIAPPQESSHS